MLGRRPCTSEDVGNGLNIHGAEALKHLEGLREAGKVTTVVTGGRIFYTVVGTQPETEMDNETKESAISKP